MYSAGNKHEHEISLTKSALSQNIEVQITDNEKQQALTGKTAQASLKELNQDVANANSQVAKKDLTKIQEQQEAAQIAAELGAKWVGDIAKGMNWEEGSPQKVALHGLVGYLSAKVGGGNSAAGVLSGVGSEYINTQVSAYLKEHPELSPAQRKVIQQASALGIGVVIGSGLGGDNQVIKQSAQQALRTEVFNRQLHPKEMEWIKENAEKFAKAQGISQEEAEKRLITQAAQEVDFFWEKKIGETDIEASRFLDTVSGFVNDIPVGNPITFTNAQGKSQILFSASEEERLATGLYADKLRTYDENHAGSFTQTVQPNIHYNAVVSSAKEGVNNLAKAGAYALDNPGALMRQGIASAMDCAKTGDCFKEAWNQFDSASGRLLRNGYKQSDVDYLYGKSMQGEITAIEGARVAGTIAEFAPIGKGVTVLKQAKKYPSSGMDNYTRAKVGDVDYPREASKSNINSVRLKEQLSNEMLSKQGTKHENIDVIARVEIDGKTYLDTNQRARADKYANPNKPTLIFENVAAKPPMKDGSPRPNGNMAEAHAEIGAIQQAYERGVTKGKDMVIHVQGKDVCGHCRQDIALAAEKAGLKSVTVQAVDEDGKVLIYDWKPTMKSIKLRQEH